MKKIYTAVAMLLLTSSVFAQIPYRHLFGSAFNGEELQQLKAARLPALHSNTRDIYQFYVDCSAANFDDLFYVWPFNSDYDANDAFPLNYEGVVLNYLAGYTDPSDPINSYIDWSFIGLTDSFPSDVSVTVDSIYNLVSQMNITGHFDTLVLKLVKTSSTGAPSTASSNILWEHRDSVDYGLSYYNNWLGYGATIVYYAGPEYTIPNPGDMIAGVFEYHNKDKADTCGIIGGCVDDGSGYAAGFSVYQNSYMRLPPNIPNLTKNANIGYDLDGNGSLDRAFEAQNWNMFFLVTVNTVLGVSDNFDNLKVTGITPNPASGATNILYGLNEASDVTINLYDLSGRLLKQLYEGHDGQGSFTRNINLDDVNAGTYLVSVQAGNATPVVNKLVVAK